MGCGFNTGHKQKADLCVQEAEGVYTCLCANTVFLLQEKAIYALGGNSVVCPKICFVSDVKVKNASASMYPPAQLGV